MASFDRLSRSRPPATDTGIARIPFPWMLLDLAVFCPERIDRDEMAYRLEVLQQMDAAFVEIANAEMKRQIEDAKGKKGRGRRSSLGRPESQESPN